MLWVFNGYGYFSWCKEWVKKGYLQYSVLSPNFQKRKANRTTIPPYSSTKHSWGSPVALDSISAALTESTRSLWCVSFDSILFSIQRAILTSISLIQRVRITDVSKTAISTNLQLCQLLSASIWQQNPAPTVNVKTNILFPQPGREHYSNLCKYRYTTGV